MAAYKEIIYDVADKVATIALNRPERLNAWTATIESELREAMHAAAADRGVNVIVLTGAGRGFCAGADISDGAGSLGDTDKLFGDAGKDAAAPRQGGGFIGTTRHGSFAPAHNGRLNIASKPGGMRAQQARTGRSCCRLLAVFNPCAFRGASVRQPGIEPHDAAERDKRRALRVSFSGGCQLSQGFRMTA